MMQHCQGWACRRLLDTAGELNKGPHDVGFNEDADQFDRT